MLFLGRFSEYKRTNHPSRSVHVMGSFYASIHLGQFELSFSRGPWEWGWWSIPFIQNKTSTLPKTNIAPTNGWLEYYFPIGEAYFQGLR